MISIAEEIRNDREKGAKRLESEYKEGLLVLARRFCSDESDAEALVYRTFAEVIEGIDGYTEKSAFFGWMCKILVNCHAKEVRRKSNSTIIVTGNLPDMADEDGAERVFASVDSSILRDAITRLPKEMKDAVILHYFMEMSLKEIAVFLTVPVGTVMSRLHYARIALARRLATQLKKPSVALMAAALLLLGATAAMVVGRISEEQTIANAETSSDETVSVLSSSKDRTMTNHLTAHEQPVTPVIPQSKAQPLFIVTSPPMNLSTLRVRADIESTGVSQDLMSVPAPERVGDMRSGAALTALDTRVHIVRLGGLGPLDTVVHDRKSGPNMNLNCTKRSFTLIFR